MGLPSHSIILAGGDLRACSFVQDGKAPLHYASSEGHLPVATLLLDRGAAIEARDKVRHNNP